MKACTVARAYVDCAALATRNDVQFKSMQVVLP